mgnify:CR=1 FL=1
MFHQVVVEAVFGDGLDVACNVFELIASPHIQGDGVRGVTDSLIEIQGVGIAARDVDATSAAVQETFGEPILWSDSELSAVGDHHAVVIVAPTGRGWIPVDLTATPLPTEIVAYDEARFRAP